MDRVSLPLLYQLVTAQTTHVISSGCVDIPATPRHHPTTASQNTILNESDQLFFIITAVRTTYTNKSYTNE